jgi:hypothetical protein
MLRAKQPEAVQKRLKVLFYGNAGVGKTIAAIQFPQPYIIDTEKGAENAQYIRHLKKQNGALLQTTDFEEIIKEIKTLLVEKHNYRTLVIDPLTAIYDNLLDAAEKKVGSAFGKHVVEANKKIKHLLNLLIRLDMNVIITSHAKNLYSLELNGKNREMILIGQTFDCYKKLDYLFDLVLEISKEPNSIKRYATIKKSRLETFPENEVFEFSYNTIAERYGQDTIEKAPIEIKMATKDQIEEFEKLIALLKVPEEAILKWLDKTHADTFSEMHTDDMQKCINHLLSKIEKGK